MFNTFIENGIRVMENDDGEVVEDSFVEKKRSVTESDAVHPRFLNAEKSQNVQDDYEANNYFYCETCKLYFAPDDKGLRIHFKEDIIKHKPCGNCFYCGGPVYTYLLCNKIQKYHNCKSS